MGGLAVIREQRVKERDAGVESQSRIVVLSIHPAWGLPIRKFRIQSQRAVLSPRSLSLVTSLEDTVVLNVEL